MGKGDKKTKKGKIFMGSFGKSRPKNPKKVIKKKKEARLNRVWLIVDGRWTMCAIRSFYERHLPSTIYDPRFSSGRQPLNPPIPSS